ncbi:MAG: SPOR domain-containing protein, partial [Calditrichia bacterium]
QTLFSETSQSAIADYISLYNKADDPRLKNLIVDRTSQYYYANGYYETASRLMQDESYREEFFSSKNQKTIYGVQLGAFLSRQNAVKLKSRFSGELSDLNIIAKRSGGGEELHIVVTGRLDSREAAEKLKQDIYNNFKHKGIVIQY